ncbi:MAG: 16S rRNA (cytidine(1402)-2'-O)-methyltransferase [Spirochaetota bacterium]
MPKLYMVATPIGNLSDITMRALETLKAVDLIVCEDTRHSRRLLDHYGIRKPLRSGHGHNEVASALGIVSELERGSDVAYVSDAGTPGVSDPGRVMVRTVRDAGFPVVPIPGPSAFSALLSANGFPGKAVTFEGFLSPKQGRRRSRLSQLLETGDSFVLYESPHRVLKLLADLTDLDSERRVLLGRELTKLHEELVEGSAGEVLEMLSQRQSIKGEIALLVGPPKKG